MEFLNHSKFAAAKLLLSFHVLARYILLQPLIMKQHFVAPTIYKTYPEITGTGQISEYLFHIRPMRVIADIYKLT